MLFSYIDPGTGSLLGSAVVGLSLALLYYLRGLFYRLIRALTGRRNACDGDFSGKLVFFSEGRNYWPVFRPVCEELLKKRHDFVYLTAGADDPGLAQLPQALYLGKMGSAIYTMNRLRARLCVMTTPQLDVMQLKRSSGVAHYCHIMHSPSDVHTYEKFAFDHFDSVLCTSQYVLDNLRFLEGRRQTGYMRKKGLVRPRQLFQTGCPYYQNYFDENGCSVLPQNQNVNLGPCVLLASSWGERSFLNQIEWILEELLSLSYRVIFRPHPQAWTSDAAVLEWVERQYGARIQIDRALDNRPSMAEADVLICDISGIIYDFAFLYQKPVLALVQQRVETMGYESADLDAPDAAFALLDDVGAVLSLDKDSVELGRVLPNVFREALREVLRKEVSQEIVDKHVFHFDCAGRVAAEQIVQLYKN